MNNLFKDKTTFNQDISEWNTASVTRMDGMFHNASSFNQNLSGWNLDSEWCHSFGNMFKDAVSFNGFLPAVNKPENFEGMLA